MILSNHIYLRNDVDYFKILLLQTLHLKTTKFNIFSLILYVMYLIYAYYQGCVLLGSHCWGASFVFV